MIPGEIFPAEGIVTLNEDRETVLLHVENSGDRPIQIGSHFHFFEVNKLLSFDRERAYGYRLDIPAGTAVRFEPGDSKDVNLVAIGGRRLVRGLNDLVNGYLDEEQEKAFQLAKEKGFSDEVNK